MHVRYLTGSLISTSTDVCKPQRWITPLYPQSLLQKMISCLIVDIALIRRTEPVVVAHVFQVDKRRKFKGCLQIMV